MTRPQVELVDKVDEECQRARCKTDLVKVIEDRLHYVTKHPHVSLITFNNGLATLKTKSGGGIPGRVLGKDFVLRGPNPFLKSDQKVMWMISHG